MIRRLTRSLAAASLALASPAIAQSAQGAAHAGAKSSATAGTIAVRWLGHAAFEVVSPGGTRILIDPWLAQNPSTPDSLKAAARWTGDNKPAAILVSHAHFDHAADAKALATATGAPVISAFEWVNTLGLPEAQALGGNVGGTFTVGDVIVHMVPAMHSSEPGRPVGFVLHFKDGRTLYHTGDTWVFGDMALIEARYHPSIILMGMGGGPYTEDPATAAFAVQRYFHPKVIVPMHYATFPALATEAQVRAAFKGDSRLHVMKPGETAKF